MSTSVRFFTLLAVVLVAGSFLAACTPSWMPRFGAQKTEVSPMPAGSLDEPTATPTTPTMMMGKDVQPLSNSTEPDAIDKDLSSTAIEQEDFSDL
jgi:hypothetical protein